MRMGLRCRLRSSFHCTCIGEQQKRYLSGLLQDVKPPLLLFLQR